MHFDPPSPYANPRMILTDHLLIATPLLADTEFARSVIYLCDHGDEGALGLVINAPSDAKLSEVFIQMDLNSKVDAINQKAVMVGGPIHQERGFVIHPPACGDWDSTLPISEKICLTTSRSILRAIACNEGPRDFLVVLGYAGWSPGQLEEEIAKNLWLSCPSDPEIVFHTPFAKRWQQAMSRLGIPDLINFSWRVGHA